jgi:hypothetical protein
MYGDEQLSEESDFPPAIRRTCPVAAQAANSTENPHEMSRCGKDWERWIGGAAMSSVAPDLLWGPCVIYELLKQDNSLRGAK